MNSHRVQEFAVFQANIKSFDVTAKTCSDVQVFIMLADLVNACLFIE